MSPPIEVRIFQDAIAEENEQFTVVLSNPVNAAFQDGQTTLSQVVNIFDDEPTVSMEAAGPEVTEGRDVVFNLTRSGSIADEFTVWLQVIESAPRNVSSQVTATFPAGQATTELVVATENDYRLLDNYTVTAVLNAAESDDLPPAYHREEPLTAEVTVRDDDLPNVHLILGRHQPGGRVNEGDPVKFWIGRTNTAYNNPLAVPLLISGAPGYTTGQIPTVVTIPAWSDSVQVVIPTEDDDVVEDTGELTIKLLGSDGYLLRHPNTGTFSIFDDDGHLPGVSVSAVEPWVDEGEDVTFPVTRSGSGQDIYSQEPLDARLRLYRVRARVTPADLGDPTQGITTPRDTVAFDEEEIALSFPSGTTTLTVTRSTTDDDLNHGNTTYHAVVLAGPEDSYTDGYRYTASTWVQDDDRPVVTVTAPIAEIYGHAGQIYPYPTWCIFKILSCMDRLP